MHRLPLLPDRARPLVFAHRGCSSLAPENTFAAFRKARDTGAPGIELDVHVCASGELVVAHDDTFARCAGDGRAIKNLDYREIRAIDAGAFFGASFRGERPPLLEEVLEEFCPGMYVDIELKSKLIGGDRLPELAAGKIRSMGEKVLESLTVSSFNPFCLGAFKKRCPRVPAAIIWSADREVPRVLRRGFGRFISGCDYLKPRRDQAGVFSVFRFSVLEGRPVVPWTVDDGETAKEMLQRGCQGIISNRPQDLGLVP